MKRILEHGGITFLIIYINNEYYYLDGFDIIKFIEENTRKSIPYNYIKEKGFNIKLQLRPKLDYLKVRNLLLKFLDKDTYDYSIKDFTYYYDFNNPIILEENNNNQEISDNDIIRESIFLIKSVINELIIHTTYYPSDIKKIYLEFLNTKENQMIEKLQELKRPETKILAKVI